jgi:leader peptidase (prepilin peptidase)/N-methyltransferase
LAAVLGLCIGNLINLIAVQLLAEKPWLSFDTRCEKCGHELGFVDQIPLFSFFVSGGRCRYCKQPTSWLFPSVELGTALLFVFFIYKWSESWYLVGMLVLGCTLIAATVTDIKTRLIPHDITYPSMFCGVLFSALVRHDLLGALVGVGISYLIFDFLAHYGLKIYLTLHPQMRSETSGFEVELIGGADAVLAAVIASWLGWQRLITALIVSFIVGAFIGIGYALHQVYTSGELGKTIRAGLLGAVAGGIALMVPIALMNALIRDITLFVVTGGIFGALLGFVCGVVAAGPKEPKPFPFGPALAIGGFVAMFYQADYSGRI